MVYKTGQVVNFKINKEINKVNIIKIKASVKMNKKKIIYLTNARLPTEKAHGLATVKICEAFADLDYEVTIISPILWRKNQKDVFSYYDIKKNFKIIKIFSIDLIPFKFFQRITFLIQVFSFSIFSFFYILFKYWKSLNDIVFFSHDHIPLFFISFISKNIFYDIHHFPDRNFLYKRILKKAFGFGTQTKWKMNMLKEKFGINFNKIIYWPNGTDIKKFMLSISQDEARKKLKLPEKQKIVLYVGSLISWKGVDSLVGTINFLSEDIFIYIVGSSPEDIKRFKKEFPIANHERVIFIPFQHTNIIPIWYKSADVLILPNTGKQKVSTFYTSPMKLFEYMTSGVPIIASKILSIEEIVNENLITFAEADNPKSFANMIESVLKNENVSRNKALLAQKKVFEYTWLKRAEKITDYINNFKFF